MKIPEIKYNIAIDFIHSILMLFKGNESLNKDTYHKFFVKNKDIEDYINWVKDNMNPFLKRDMEFLCGDFVGAMIYLLFYIIRNDFTSVNAFLNAFEKVSGEDFLKQYLEEYDINLPLDANEKELKKVIKESLTFDVKTKDSEVFIEFRKYPDDMKKRFDRILREYYDNFFKCKEEEIKNFMRNKVIEHIKLFNEDYDRFIKTILLIGGKEILNEKYNVHLYVDYFTQFGSMMSLHGREYYYFYGYSLEQRYSKEFVRRQNKVLFKLLSDENRYEILKLLGQRPWYGKELADHFNITPATLSYHINKIAMLGLINVTEGENKRSYFELNKDNLQDIFDNILKDILD